MQRKQTLERLHASCMQIPQAVADALLRNCNISTIQRLQRHDNATNSMSDRSRDPTQRQNNHSVCNTGSQLQ